MSEQNEFERANELARQAWEENASFWDERMGEGNDFVELLTWPATERLLGIRQGMRVLDIACGNGLTSRRLAALGAEVVALDFSPAMIELARQRAPELDPLIDYRVIDATDQAELLSLGERRYDAALCAMALFDMADVSPLFQALSRLLRPKGIFVFSIIHPCFNSAKVTHVAEMEDREGELVTVYSMKVSAYMTPTIARGVAIPGQPKPQLYFHRPLQDLFGVAFQAGFVLDGLEERAFPPEHRGGSKPLSWSGNYSEIPPVLVARMSLARSPD